MESTGGAKFPIVAESETKFFSRTPFRPAPSGRIVEILGYC
jgi:hypothetical protein